MRRLWATAAAIVLCLALGGMPVMAQEAAEQPSAAGTTIGFTNMFQDGGFFSDIEAGAREAAAAAGVELLVETAWGNPTTQANQVTGFIEQGVDTIIITPVDPDAIVASVEAANGAGIPVLTVDRAASGGTVASVIASDNVAAGRMAGEALFAAMGGSGKVVEIQGDMAVSSGSLRSEGFQEALAAAPDIALAVQAPAYFDYGMAYQATQQALEDDPDIGGVFAANLGMLYGAVEGVAAAGRQGQVRVTGVDVEPDILEMIRDGRIEATVVQQPRLMGQIAVEAALAAAAGGWVDSFIPVETTLVTADNVEAFMAGEEVAAQTPSPMTTEQATTEVLFDITLPAEVLPDQLTKTNTLMLTVAPGTDVSIGIDNEAIRGRALYLDTGELVIEPMADALLWRGADAMAGRPETAPAGEPVELAPGDVIFLPAIEADDLVPGAVVRIVNPGPEDAVTMGFHTHAAGGGFPGWPDGVTGVGMAEYANPYAMALVMDGDATFRLSRMTAESGTAVPVSDDAMFSMVEVLVGEVERTLTGAGGDNVRTWQAGQGGVVYRAPEVTTALVAVSDTPAVVMEVAVTADEAAEVPGESEAEPSEPTGVVVTLSDFAEVSEGEWTSESEAAYNEGLGITHTYTWEATDPRLSGAATYTGNWHWYGSLASSLEAFQWTVGNDEGSWTGTGYSIFSPAAAYGDAAAMVMDGAGAYEGLTAYLNWDIAHEEDTMRGLITADPMPPVPEPTSE
jgi:ribose transport system substrate-binding protein